MNDAKEFSLWLSKHILRNVLRVLADRESGYGWEADRAEEYVNVLREVAEASGGGVAAPGDRVTDLEDDEDNRILELARACNASVIVTLDGILLDQSPRKGIPIIHPRDFTSRVSEMRLKHRRPST